MNKKHVVVQRAIIYAISVFAIFGVVWAVDSSFICIGDGICHYSVHISNNGPPLKIVMCVVEGNQKKADEIRQHILVDGGLPDLREPPQWNDPYDGKPIDVRSWHTVRKSASGRVISRTWQGFVVVIGETETGQRCGKIVDLPDYRSSTNVYVTLP